MQSNPFNSVWTSASVLFTVYKQHWEPQGDHHTVTWCRLQCSAAHVCPPQRHEHFSECIKSDMRFSHSNVVNVSYDQHANWKLAHQTKWTCGSLCLFSGPLSHSPFSFWSVVVELFYFLKPKNKRKKVQKIKKKTQPLQFPLVDPCF